MVPLISPLVAAFAASFAASAGNQLGNKVFGPSPLAPKFEASPSLFRRRKRVDEVPLADPVMKSGLPRPRKDPELDSPLIRAFMRN